MRDFYQFAIQDIYLTESPTSKSLPMSLSKIMVNFLI